MNQSNSDTDIRDRTDELNDYINYLCTMNGIYHTVTVIYIDSSRSELNYESGVIEFAHEIHYLDNDPNVLMHGKIIIFIDYNPIDKGPLDISMYQYAQIRDHVFIARTDKY